MELKSRKNVLYLIAVGLLDLRACSQSDITSAERRGVFGNLRVSHFLQSGEEEGECGWCMVSSFASVCLSLSVGVLVCGLLSAFFLSGPTVKKFVFYIVFLFWSDQIGFSLFFTAKVTDWPKNYFKLFLFFDKFHRHFAMHWSYEQKPLFFHFEESLSTNNIQWMLSWVLVVIIILCVQ